MEYIFNYPKFDEPTTFSFQICKELVDYMKEKGETVIDLPAEQAVRKNVEAACKQYPYAMLISYDHGDKDAIIGNDVVPVIDLDNVDLLANREVYNMNCLSAKILGVVAYKDHNCKVYWGYIDTVSFTTDMIPEFTESVNYGFYQHIKYGIPWKDALSNTKARMAELVNKLVADGKYIAASCLNNDSSILVCYDGGSEPAEISCPFRSLGVKLFGKIGARLSRKIAISQILFYIGFGVALGKLTHTLWTTGGLKEVFSLQGDYIGYAMMFVGFIIATYEYIQRLKK